MFHLKKNWLFFSWNQSCQQLKSPKLQHFHEFSPKTLRQFFSWSRIFGQKFDFSTVQNKDFGLGGIRTHINNFSETAVRKLPFGKLTNNYEILTLEKRDFLMDFFYFVVQVFCLSTDRCLHCVILPITRDLQRKN